MKKNEYTKTCGQIIREAREKKNMTINDLAFELRNEKITEKDIKRWESGKDFPNLDQCYKIAYVIDINPTELLIFRDRQRKAFIRKTDKPKKKLINISEDTMENIYYVAITGIKLLIILIAAFVARGFAMTFDAAINGGAEELEEVVVKTIEDNVNDIEDNEENTMNTDNNIYKNEIYNHIINDINKVNF